MLHNCTGLPENKQWCMAKIFSRGDDSDPSSWVRPCLAADGATCNLSSKCRAREGKQKSETRSRGHKMIKHKLSGAFGDTQHFGLFWIKAMLKIMRKKTESDQYYTTAHVRVEGCGWLCAGWQSSWVPRDSHSWGSLKTAQDTAVRVGHMNLVGVAFLPQDACNDTAFSRCQFLPGAMNGQVPVFCRTRELWTGSFCLGVSLLRALQMILAAGLLHLYCRNVFATKSAVPVGFAGAVLTFKCLPVLHSL